MFAMSHKLAPLFANDAIDIHLAWQMAVSAIEAYQPQTRADYVNVARTIAFSMAAITLLGDAAAKHLTLPDKMRLFGRANALNRSADQSERTMMQRQRHHRANPRADYQTNFSPDPEPRAPEPDLDDAAAEAAVAETVAACRAALTPDPADAPASATTPAPKPPAEPRPSPLHSPAGSPVTAQASAIRYAGPEPVTQPAPSKQDLLRHTAMQRVVDHTAPTHPGPIQAGSFPPAQAALRRPQPPANHSGPS
jgi:hypothetical protein